MFFKQIATIIHQHPKRLAALAAALMLSIGGGAYAVVSLEESAEPVVVRNILEALHNGNDQDKESSFKAATPITAMTLVRSTSTRANDTADTLLKRLGIFDAAASAYLRSSPDLQKALFSRTGRTVHAEATADNTLLNLTVRWMEKDDARDFQRLRITQSPNGFTTAIDTAPLVITHAVAGGVIESSLFAATDASNVPDVVAVQFAELFAGDIDFRRALRKGDRFQMVYETLQADNEIIGAGQLLSAEFINAGKLHQAMWFQEVGSKGQYYSLEGLSLRKAFLASPLKYTRVSSGFGIRVHPISKDKRAHKGIDYAAPTGTPVRTVGDGVIAFAGVQRGYGNVIEVAHRNSKTTVFAHLSRIDVKKGQKVEQGAVIGAVGSTGFSTGPHLHFEFRVDGEHQDPLTIANERNTQPISAAAKPAFDKAASLLKLQLKDAATIVQARAQ
ncbi:MAG TPA: M23 family metallopeptidase [Burkholderiaceae bacterium]|nr:M23 family metallopeptidase [Burkholderiaceae bacterium]